MENILLRIIVTPLIPVVFAYFELGGNWFALRLLQNCPSLWSVLGTIILSVVYSLISALVAFKLKMDLGLLMVAYGFGFSIVVIFFKFDWGRYQNFL